MENEYTNDNSAGLKVLRLFGILLILFGIIVVGTFLARLVLSIFIDPSLLDPDVIVREIEDRQYARSLLLLLQGSNTLFTFIILPLLYILFYNKRLKEVLNFKKPKTGIFILLSIGIIFSAMPFVGQLVEWNKAIQLPEALSGLQELFETLERKAEEYTKLMVFYDHVYEIIAIVLVIAIIPGIGEELLFRGIIQNEIKGIFSNPHVAIWATGILFSLIHFQFEGFIPRAALGALFGYLYYWSGNLLVPIVIHFLNNAYTFVAMNYMRFQETEVEASEPTTSPAVTIIFSIICIMLLIAFHRLSEHTKNTLYD
ncbi:MAG: lysostaphin resistance A-like protein [Cytophagaceae bacterium]